MLTVGSQFIQKSEKKFNIGAYLLVCLIFLKALSFIFAPFLFSFKSRTPAPLGSLLNTETKLHRRQREPFPWKISYSLSELEGLVFLKCVFNKNLQPVLIKQWVLATTVAQTHFSTLCPFTTHLQKPEGWGVLPYIPNKSNSGRMELPSFFFPTAAHWAPQIDAPVG